MTNFVLENIKERSSTRAYTDQTLTSEEMQALVQAALQAPTARNDQELHFTIASTTNKTIQELNAELGAGRGNPNMCFYYHAPTLILISARENYTFESCDAGIAVQTIALAAESLGLGSVIIGCIKSLLNGEKKAYFNEKLGIPEGYSFEIAIAVGHKAATKVPHDFKAEELVNYID